MAEHPGGHRPAVRKAPRPKPPVPRKAKKK